ncbi:hypothetical protein NHQ30_000599 [Ciborinia camelliae]|nr:hypothetical protein NHQ30_000599 [Ciborinia camelliae]
MIEKSSFDLDIIFMHTQDPAPEYLFSNRVQSMDLGVSTSSTPIQSTARTRAILLRHVPALHSIGHGRARASQPETWKWKKPASSHCLPDTRVEDVSGRQWPKLLLLESAVVEANIADLVRPGILSCKVLGTSMSPLVSQFQPPAKHSSDARKCMDGSGLLEQCFHNIKRIEPASDDVLEARKQLMVDLDVVVLTGMEMHAIWDCTQEYLPI